MPLNSKGYTDAALRDNFQPGQGYLREYAAYCMDVDHRAQVPTTLLVQCRHKILNYGSLPCKFPKIVDTNLQSGRQDMQASISDGGPRSICPPPVPTQPKTGSLQHFIDNASIFDDFGYNAFSDYEIQKIALFDMRILNCDRNGGNILVSKNHIYSRSRMGSNLSDSCDGNTVFHSDSTTFDYEYSTSDSDSQGSTDSACVLECIPIDHGYAFPTQLCINDFDWCWFNCPQIGRPTDPRLVEYLRELDVDEVIADIRVSKVKRLCVRHLHYAGCCRKRRRYLRRSGF
jgi:hypothetical protein